MSFSPGTRVLLLIDVKGGRVGDECVVISSKNGWIKLSLVGADCELSVRKSQIKVIEKTEKTEDTKPFEQMSMFSRWAIDAEIENGKPGTV